jgi:hypothetical protein
MLKMLEALARLETARATPASRERARLLSPDVLKNTR